MIKNYGLTFLELEKYSKGGDGGKTSGLCLNEPSRDITQRSHVISFTNKKSIPQEISKGEH